jgi:hypothetical protein
MEWDLSVDSVEEVVTTPLRLIPPDTLLSNLKLPLITLDSSSELQLEQPFWLLLWLWFWLLFLPDNQEPTRHPLKNVFK